MYNPEVMSSIEAKLQAGTKEFQKIQTGKRPTSPCSFRASPSEAHASPLHRSCCCATEYGKAVEHRQRLDAQKSESEAVKKVRRALLPLALALRSSATLPTDLLTRLRYATPLVIQEFASLTPSNTIYKQVGPVLLKQDQAEAKANVDKRLEFINSEM